MPAQKKLEMVQSYTRVRLALGLIGLLLPIILVLGGIYGEPRIGEDPRIEPTISDFYHTTYRDIFVGALCAMGVFLIAYRGYARTPGEWINDDWLATIAGIAAFGLAFFPNEGTKGKVVSAPQDWVGPEWSPWLHYAFALTFFLSLACFCFYKFPKSRRAWRCRVYRACGWAIMAALAATAVAVIFKQGIKGDIGAWVEQSSLIFYLEAFGVWAFAISWIVKSRADLAFVQAITPGRAPEDDADRDTTDNPQ